MRQLQEYSSFVQNYFLQEYRSPQEYSNYALPRASFKSMTSYICSYNCYGNASYSDYNYSAYSNKADGK